MTWPPTISLVPGRTFPRDHVDIAQTPQERCDRTLTWIESSGPCYVTLPIGVCSVSDGGAILQIEDEAAPIEYALHMFSLASWLILCASKPGDRIEVKIRVDDAKARAK